MNLIDLARNAYLGIEKKCFGRPLDRQLRVFFLLIGIATLVLAALSLAARGFDKGFQITPPEGMNLLWAFWGIFLCLVVGYVLGHHKADKYTSELANLIREPLKKSGRSLSFLMLIFCLAFAFAWVITAFVGVGVDASKTRTEKAFWFLFENPGGAFAIITGVVTVAGTYLTLISMNKMKATFASFNDFLSRATIIVDDAARDGDSICVCSMSPVPGILQAEARHVTSYHQALERLAGAATKKSSTQAVAKRVSMIILSQNDLAMWLSRFDGRSKRGGSTVTSDEVREAVANNERFLTGSEMKEGADIQRLSAEQIPGSYYVCSSQCAVICIPLFIPLPGGAEAAERSLENMQMVGFETTDHVIIDFLRAYHCVYADKVSSINEIIATGDVPRDVVDKIRALLGNTETVAEGADSFRARFYAAVKSTADSKAASAESKAV